MKCWAAYHKDDNIRMKSSSGGVFYALAEYVIRQHGVVFGATWNKDWLVDITYAETLEQVKPMMGSKYVLANVGNSFEQCKHFLDQGRLVLYTSIPCQITGLKNYLKKEYNNLITIAIACEGTMPIQIWKDYLNLIKKPNCTITDIKLRDKTNTTWNKYNCSIFYSDGSTLIEHHNNNEYIKRMLNFKELRPCCYGCIFKKKPQSDLIIGDWWCIQNHYPEIDVNKGVSFIICNTYKGIKVLSIISKNLFLTECEVEEVKKYNIGIKGIYE